MDFPYHDKKCFCQLPHRICSSRPGGSGEQYGQKVATFSRAYSRGLYCFQPQGSPASSCWPVLCVSLSARTESMPAGLAKSQPVTGFIARRRDFLRVVAHTARMLVCPGGCPYCWYALFKERREANIQCPSLSLPDNRGVDKGNPKNFCFLICLAMYGNNASKSYSQRGNACQDFAAHDKMKSKLGGVAL